MASCCYHLKDVIQLLRLRCMGGVVFRKATATRPCFDLTRVLTLFGGNDLVGSLNLAILCPDLEQHCRGTPVTAEVREQPAGFAEVSRSLERLAAALQGLISFCSLWIALG